MPNSEKKDIAEAIEVVAGSPTENELAAVIAVLREATSTKNQPKATEPNWAKGPQVLRDSKYPGDYEWRSDFKGEI